jgi:hypothetical protein
VRDGFVRACSYKGFGGCPSDRFPKPTKDGKLACECPWGFDEDDRGKCICEGMNPITPSKATAKVAWKGGSFACMSEDSCEGAGLGWNSKTLTCQQDFKIELDMQGIYSKGAAASKYDDGDHYYRAAPATQVR